MNPLQPKRSRRTPAELLRCRPFASRLVPYSEGKLGRAERQAIEAHLDSCESCGEELAAIHGIGALLADHAAEETSATPARSVDLWSRIEAEIAPARSPWEESPKMRRRFVFGLDPSWPNTVPVGVALASAVVFGVVLVSGHKAMKNREASAQTASTESVDTSLLGDPISVSIRPAAPVAVASETMIRPLHRPKAASSVVAKPAMALAAAAALQREGVRSDPFALVAPAKAKATMVAPSPTPLLVASALSRHQVVSLVAPQLSTQSGKDGRSLVAGLAADKSEFGGLGFGGGAFRSERRDALALDSTVTAAAQPERNVSDQNAATAGGAMTPDSADSAAKANDGGADSAEDAAIRGNTPTARPMVDLAAVSRRQRGLFSYSPH